MKSWMLLIALLFLAIQLSSALNAGRPRHRRDLTCATGGHRLCSFFCKGRGHRDGECVWETESGSYECMCDDELRGIRCNLGGPNTCHYSCVVLGYRSGRCEGADMRCVCGGGYNRWGEVIDSVRQRI